MLLKYPDKTDLERIAKTFDFQRLNIHVEDFHAKGNSIDVFFQKIELEMWVHHLQNRIHDVWKSYVFLAYYFEMGIPDDEWFISPGKQGESVQYYPHFEKKHFQIKSEFDYYVDTFYYKIFSAWDTIGHLLNILYGLKMKKPSLLAAIDKLKSANSCLYGELRAITRDSDFKRAKELRNDITHNYPPSTIDSGIKRESEHKISFGVGSYTPSKDFYENILISLDLLAKTLDCVKQK